MTIYDMVYEEEQQEIYNILLNPPKAVIDPLHTGISPENQISFLCHVKRGSMETPPKVSYEYVQFTGYFSELDDSHVIQVLMTFFSRRQWRCREHESEQIQRILRRRRLKNALRRHRKTDDASADSRDVGCRHEKWIHIASQSRVEISLSRSSSAAHHRLSAIRGAWHVWLRLLSLWRLRASRHVPWGM